MNSGIQGLPLNPLEDHLGIGIVDLMQLGAHDCIVGSRRTMVNWKYLMIQQHVLVGGTVVALCLFVFSREHWVLEKTTKGQRLVRWFGLNTAPWVLRGLTAGGMVFGGLLAAGIIRPIQW